MRGLRAESTTAAATALVVLTTGASDEPSTLLSRLADTGIGIAVGLLVNLIVWPPLRDRSAAAHVDAIDDRLGELLCEMAETLRGSAATRTSTAGSPAPASSTATSSAPGASCARRARAAG